MLRSAAAALATLLGLVSALPFDGAGLDIKNGILSIPFEKRALPGSNLRSRANSALFSANYAWWMNISYGTPPQVLPVLPDLGSGDFTVQSSLLPASEKGNDPVYIPGASSTSYQLPGYTYSECYGSGYCDRGVVFTDTLNLRGISIPGVPIQAINSASSVSSNSQSGNIGLSFGTPQAANPRGVSGFLWSIRPYLGAGVFTINYNKGTSTGQFDFGYVDTSKFTGSMIYAPLDVSSNYGGEWVVQLTGILVNGVFQSYKFPVLFDSGTGGSSIPRQIADWYFSQVPGSVWNTAWNQYQYPCSATLPDFTFGLINGARVTIHGPDLLAFSIDGGTTCLSDLGVGGSDTTIWLFGENIIATMFMVFDFDNAQIGWGVKSTSGSPTGTAVSSAPSIPSSAGSAYVCSGTGWSGTCQHLSWPNFACKNLVGTAVNYHVGSFGPDSGSCTLYGDSLCVNPISGLTGIKNPGSSSTSGTLVGCYMCTTSISSVGSGTFYLCTGSNWSGTCSNLSWNSYVCQSLSQTFTKAVGSAGPNHGNCMFYNDAHCVFPASSQPLQSPGSGSVSYGKKVGSFICI